MMDAAVKRSFKVLRATRASRAGGVMALILFAVLASFPFWADSSWLRLFAEFACFLVLAQMWNLLAGYGGLVSVGQQAFIGLGGNFIRAVPETDLMERAWRQLEMTVQIVTKLNRGAIIHGRDAYLLPCLGRIEIDRQATGVQFVTVEDTTGRFHASHGQAEPASKDILSEPKIVAELAKAILAPNPRVDWDAWSGNYALVRDAIAETYPKIFENFNERIKNPAGFDRPLPARERKWTTPNGKANFISPRSLSEDPDLPRTRVGVLTLITLRSNDQFNTTMRVPLMPRKRSSKP